MKLQLLILLVLTFVAVGCDPTAKVDERVNSPEGYVQFYSQSEGASVTISREEVRKIIREEIASAMDERLGPGTEIPQPALERRKRAIQGEIERLESLLPK